MVGDLGAGRVGEDLRVRQRAAVHAGGRAERVETEGEHWRRRLFSLFGDRGIQSSEVPDTAEEVPLRCPKVQLQARDLRTIKI